MPEQGSSLFINKFKNYTINVSIVLLAVLTIYLFYNFIKRATTDQPVERPPVADTTLHGLTKQPSNRTLQIDVQNGSGVQGIAGKVTEYLRANGFDVVEMGNFAANDIKTSMVIDRTGNTSNAKRVARNLGIQEKYVIQQVNKNYFLDATVVLGKDYLELYPFKENNNN